MGDVLTMPEPERQGHLMFGSCAMARPARWALSPRKRERERSLSPPMNSTARARLKTGIGFVNNRKQREPMMSLQALGYVGFGSSALDDWRQFGTSLVGWQAVERSPPLLAFRMDDRKQRIVVDRAMAEGERFFGWEVADAAALDALAVRLE